MLGTIAPRTVRLERPRLDVVLDVMRGAALESARGTAADGIVVEVAREVDGNDARAFLEALARKLRARVAYVGDGFGGDDVQNLEATLARGAGDCDDFAAGYAALAMRAGYRAGFAVLLDESGATASHVLPVVELDGQEVPVELTRAVPFGSWPADRSRFAWFFLSDPWGSALGFIGPLVSAVASIFTGDQQAKAIKANAKATTAAAETAAAASTNAAVIAERTAAEERLSRERIVASSLAFGRSALPMLGKMVGIVAAARVLEALASRKPAPRARAPRKVAA